MQSPPLPLVNPYSHVTPSLIRAYHVWKGNNVFFCRGRLIFGPDVKCILISAFLLVAPVGVFCAFVARELFDDFPHHLGWSIMIVMIVHTLFVMITLLLTSGRDPGIVPRNVIPPEPNDNNGESSRPPLPQTRDVIVNGITVKVKYCNTCLLYRPLRCSHCSQCDNCVERFDHHCPWLGQCIGLRNYKYYYMFVLSATILCFYIHGFCWVYIIKIQHFEKTSIWKAMIKTPASIVLICYTFLCGCFVGGLTALHTYLIVTNQSTHEAYKGNEQSVNPFNKGIIENIKEVFCTRIPPSKVNFRSKVPIVTLDSDPETVIWYLRHRMNRTTRDVELTGSSVSNEINQEESDDEVRFHIEEQSKANGLTDSLDLSRTLHIEDIATNVVNKVQEVGESKLTVSDNSSTDSSQ